LKTYVRYNHKTYDEKKNLVKEKIDLKTMREEIANGLKKAFLADAKCIEGTVGGADIMVHKNYYNKCFRIQMDY
jgi:hypothetical protein